MKSMSVGESRKNQNSLKHKKDDITILYLVKQNYIDMDIDLFTLYLLPITLKTVQKRIVKQINAQFHS